jgi:hypothetical protein
VLLLLLLYLSVVQASDVSVDARPILLLVLAAAAF